MCKSKGEDTLYEALSTCYVVTRWPRINNWSIDMCVNVNNEVIYVQYDGVYFHGLDRPIEETLARQNEQSKVIARTYHRDIEQNVWFRNNSLKLVRFTDIESKHLTNQQLVNLFHDKVRTLDDVV